MRILAVFGVLFVIAIPSAQAAPACGTLNSLWKSKFHSDFDVTWENKTFRCPSATSKVAKAIYDVYAPRTDFNYYNFAKGRVKEMRFSQSCNKGVVATMYPSGKMTICPAFFSDSESSRAGTIVHESVHASYRDPGHVVCTRGYYKGRKACDTRLTPRFDGSSGYNGEFRYFTELLGGANYNDLRKDLVRYSVKQMVLNRFNHVDSNEVRRWAGSGR